MPNNFNLNIAQPLQGLQGVIGEHLGRQQQEGWQEEAAALYKSGDLQALAKFSIAHPEMGQRVREQVKHKSATTEAIRRDMGRKIMTGGNYIDVVNEGIEAIERAGGDPSNLREVLDMSPEEALAATEKMMAIQFPTDFNALQAYKKSRAGPAAKEVSETAKLDAETAILEQKFSLLANNQTPTEDRIKIEKDLRKEVYDRSKVFQDVDDAWTRVQVSAKDPSPAGDMALIFNYMKMLDPGSTVREGEFATAQQTGSVDDRIVSLYNQIITGTRLSAPQRADFTKRAKSLYRAAESKNKKMTAKYKALAKRYNVDPVNVVLGSAELTDDDLVNKYL